MSEIRKMFKRLLLGLIAGLALYLFTVFFWIQGNPLILEPGHFTYVGFIAFISLAMLEANINLIGVWPKEKKASDKK